MNGAGGRSGAAAFGGVLARANFPGVHGEYYWNVLKSLPHGAARRLSRAKCSGYGLIETFVRDREGLEIGGPSPVFRPGGLIPVYGGCRRLDNANFSPSTIWDRPAQRQKPGRKKDQWGFAAQFVAEASNLSKIPDESYDFVLASHVLEHLANPLRGLEEWKRVLRTGGAMVVIAPDRRATFDRRRPPTAFEHIEADFANRTPETDLSHLEEIFALHDLALDPGAGAPAKFRERSRNNAAVRALHHHVFVPEVLVRMFSRMALEVRSLAIERPFHIIALAAKTDSSAAAECERRNRRFLDEQAAWRRRDPLAKAWRPPARDPRGER
jgi:SAM-dependent methyltransferase